jgi:hypothetical protein
MKPLALDLCCGLGGWTKGLIAAGWDVIGVDIVKFDRYPGRLIVADVNRFYLNIEPKPLLVIGSPPCEQFSRHAMPWTRKKNPPPPPIREFGKAVSALPKNTRLTSCSKTSEARNLLWAKPRLHTARSICGAMCHRSCRPLNTNGKRVSVQSSALNVRKSRSIWLSPSAKHFSGD